jgi:hypothetical protein
VIKRLFILVAVSALGACSLDKQATPALTGPSELGLSVSVSATPDQITRDGQSTSTIVLIARDANSQPVPGLSLRGDIVGDVGGNFGTLSSKVMSTDNSGMATVVFTSPPPPPPTNDSDVPVTLTFRPVSGDFSNDAGQVHNVTILLVRPGVISLPGPVAAFKFSTTPGGVHFDASASATIAGRAIIAYDWDFGDGSPHGSGVIVDHQYGNVTGQTLTITLTVTDSAGQVAVSTANIKF